MVIIIPILLFLIGLLLIWYSLTKKDETKKIQQISLPSDIEEMISFIKKDIKEKYGIDDKLSLEEIRRELEKIKDYLYVDIVEKLEEYEYLDRELSEAEILNIKKEILEEINRKREMKEDFLEELKNKEEEIKEEIKKAKKGENLDSLKTIKEKK
ncbi:MAG: hypothetical protein QW273_01385 [Candidatus Pacearchaeota archaeon]